MSILERMFALRPGKRNSGGEATPLHSLPVRSYHELTEIGSAHGSPFSAAMQGELNAEEYLKLECGVDDDIES